MITSTRNPRLQRVRDLLAHPKARREQRAFVLEGVRLIEEAWQAGWEFESVLWNETLSERGKNLVKAMTPRGLIIEEVAPAILESVSDTQTPQGLIAIVADRPPQKPAALDFVLIPDGIRDPGNLGTILRTAGAAGVQAVWLPPGNADPFAPKVLRSAMGAHFRLPIFPLAWDELHAWLRAAGLTAYLADAHAELGYTEAPFAAPTALIIGGEARGAGTEAQALAAQRLSIPMPGQSESLNAAIAAAILMYEVVRQRTNR